MYKHKGRVSEMTTRIKQFQSVAIVTVAIITVAIVIVAILTVAIFTVIIVTVVIVTIANIMPLSHTRYHI